MTEQAEVDEVAEVVDPHGTAVDTLADCAPAGSSDHQRRHPEPTPDEVGLEDAGGLEVLRRGLRATPELREGIRLTVLMAAATAAGKLAVPVLIQQILDRGVFGSQGFRAGFVAAACTLTALIIVAMYLLARSTFLRLVRTAESSLFGLRVRAFEHAHRLSIAEHAEHRRGALVARVTSDVDTMAQFTEWGAVAWIVNSVLIVATVAVMAVYSWQLALVAVLAFVPLLPLLRELQRRQLRAYDGVRTAVAGSISEVAELVGGAPVVQSYGLADRTRRRLRGAIDRQYQAQMGAAKWFAISFPLVDLFGAISLGAVVVAGTINAPSWGLDAGALIAFLFLATLLLNPIAELGEVLDQTQTALAGWRKILALLATPVEVVEPAAGLALPLGPLSVELDHVDFAYRDGPPVLHDVQLRVARGTSVAIVGETGSGKTTIAKLLSRLADPTCGVVRIGDLDLRCADADSLRSAVRLVPQDGFLFDASLRENVLLGRHGADEHDAVAAFDALGLGGWLDDLPQGLDTPVGERGSNLSVGERQLVALVRAQLGDPGLLILDEATSAVDPEAERALTGALERLAEGRTVVSIAHRLSTAERADLVVVVDEGRLVEVGPHHELVAAGGTYASLYRSWLGNTRAQ